ncbi:MAG: MFS transporter [Thermomicrobiales bacterium]
MSAARSFRSVLANRPLVTMASGHFAVDMYSGTFPVMYPALRSAYGLSLADVGLVALAYTAASSLSQPIFGMIADRYGTRWIGFTQIWCAMLFATIGFAPSYTMLLALAFLAGLGSGAFHPMGAMEASVLAAPEQANTSMSMYVSAGTIGFALGPIIGATILWAFGLHGTLVMLVPGLLIGTYLLRVMRRLPDAPVRRRPSRGGRAAIPVALVAIVVAVMMLRQVPVVGVESFLPTWYAELGYSSAFYSTLATVMILSSAVGALGVGQFADRYGRRMVILVTMTLTIPAVWAFITFPGPWAFLFGAMIGFLASSSGPLLLLMAQQLMKGSAGMASGLILGFGFISGGIAVPLLGAAADASSIPTALYGLLGVVALSLAVAWFLPGESKVRAVMEQRDAASSAADPGHEPAINPVAVERPQAS